MQKMEIRTVATALRSASEFKLEGTACSYGMVSKDLGGFFEQVRAGAFARSLASSQDVVCTFNHSADKILGRKRNGTLTLKDSPESLDFSCQLNKDSQEHRDLYSAVKRGDISECSFAFIIDNDGGPGEDFDEVSDENGRRIALRTVTAAHLLDVSCVTNPAYGNGATKVNARGAQFRSCDYNAASQTTPFVHHILGTKRVYLNGPQGEPYSALLPKQHVRYVPPTNSVDAANQRRLQALGQKIYSDKALRGYIEDRLLQKRAEQIAKTIERDGNLEEIKALGAELLGE